MGCGFGHVWAMFTKPRDDASCYRRAPHNTTQFSFKEQPGSSSYEGGNPPIDHPVLRKCFKTDEQAPLHRKFPQGLRLKRVRNVRVAADGRQRSLSLSLFLSFSLSLFLSLSLSLSVCVPIQNPTAAR